MTDKRSPQSPVMRSPKRSKTFPLTSNDEGIGVLCRSGTAPVTDRSSAAEESLSNEQTSAENGKSEPEEDPDEGTNHSPHFLPQDGQKDADQQSQASSEPDTVKTHEDTADKPLGNDGDGLPASHGDESDASAGEYNPHYFDDDESESGSHVTTFEDLNKELGRWAAPLEPLRPENPYRKGKVLEVKKHKACPPFGANYPDYEGVRKCAPERELRGKTLVELCVDRPPVGGDVLADEKPQTLEITDEIRVKEDGGAQIVVCRLSGLQQEVVAKIYDPLYYGFANRMWSAQPRDVTYEADMDYAREVAALSELDDQLGGTDVPKYYGSWTFQIPLDLPDGRKTRDVRLVLMEHIKGTVMTDLKPESFSEPTRMDLVARMVEAVSRILFAGVRHGDVSQRNVMVCLAGPDKVERVALIDFNYAVVSRLDNMRAVSPGAKPDPKPAKLPNPINKWWGGALYAVAGEWLPESWEFRLRALQEWLYERYFESEEYEPPWRELNWDEENLPRRWIAT